MEYPKKHRIEALDVFRALTMFLMLFVNDLPGLKEIPHWLLHATRNEDMLGFSDTIFPAFLFAMGMAVPYAIQSRMRRGDKARHICLHIFWRTVALVAMGVYTVNRDTLDATATGMSNPAFSTLMVIGFFLIWSVYPKASGWKRHLFSGMKIAGIAILLYLFHIYIGKNGAAFAPQWWGILGLIGWTYLVCSVIFLLSRGKLIYNAIALFLLVSLSVLSSSGVFSAWPWVRYIPGGATLHAFGMAGLCAGLIMQAYVDKAKPQRFLICSVLIGIAMLAGGIVSHQFWIISKLQSTPTWFFYCTAIFFPLFAFVYWLTDVKEKARWFDIIKPAGTVTLTCYIIPYIWYWHSVRDLLNIPYPEWMLTGIPGLIQSLIYSLSVVGIAWLLMKAKIRLKI